MGQASTPSSTLHQSGLVSIVTTVPQQRHPFLLVRFFSVLSLVVTTSVNNCELMCEAYVFKVFVTSSEASMSFRRSRVGMTIFAYICSLDSVLKNSERIPMTLNACWIEIRCQTSHFSVTFSFPAISVSFHNAIAAS